MSEKRIFFLFILLVLLSFIGNLIYNNSEKLITVKFQPKYVLKNTEQNNTVETYDLVTEKALQAKEVTKTTEQNISVKNFDQVTEKAQQAKEVFNYFINNIYVINNNLAQYSVFISNYENESYRIEAHVFFNFKYIVNHEQKENYL